MKRMIFGLILAALAFPAWAGQVAECYAIGAHNQYGRMSAARYVRLFGDRMILTGRTGRRDMPRWSLPCGPTANGLFCSGRSRGMIVYIKTDGWQMKEMVQHRNGGEVIHAVYNCNRALALP